MKGIAWARTAVRSHRVGGGRSPAYAGGMQSRTDERYLIQEGLARTSSCSSTRVATIRADPGSWAACCWPAPTFRRFCTGYARACRSTRAGHRRGAGPRASDGWIRPRDRLDGWRDISNT